jgi:hypothetical protein
MPATGHSVIRGFWSMALIGSPNRTAHAAHQGLPIRQHRLSPDQKDERVKHRRISEDKAKYD